MWKCISPALGRPFSCHFLWLRVCFRGASSGSDGSSCRSAENAQLIDLGHSLARHLFSCSFPESSFLSHRLYPACWPLNAFSLTCLSVCLTPGPIPARLDARHQPHHYRPCLSVAERRAGMSPCARAPPNPSLRLRALCAPIADSPFARDSAAPCASTGRAEATIAVSLIRLISVYNWRRPPLSTACSSMSPRLFSVSPASLVLTCASRAALHLLFNAAPPSDFSFFRFCQCVEDVSVGRPARQHRRMAAPNVVRNLATTASL